MKKNNIFIEGAISPDFISESIRKHQSKTDIGAHNIFLGQIRADIKEDKVVKCIDFSAYEDMVINKYKEIKEDLFAKYDLICMHLHHSKGRVNVGEICLFVFASSKHRKMAIQASEEIVERLKKEMPIWGKEILEDESYIWKENKY